MTMVPNKVVTTIVSLAIIFLSTYFFPLAQICYSLQVIGQPPDRHDTSHNMNINGIPLLDEDLSVDLFLWKCLGGVCGESRDHIRDSIERLMSAGNTNTNDNNGTLLSMSMDASVSEVLGQVSNKLACIIPFADNDNMRSDLQIVLFVLAGVTVMALLLFAALLSIFSSMTLCIIAKQAKQADKKRGHIEILHEILSGSVSFITLLATLLHPAILWTENARYSYRSGYIIMCACCFVMVMMSQFDAEIASLQRSTSKQLPRSNSLDMGTP